MHFLVILLFSKKIWHFSLTLWSLWFKWGIFQFPHWMLFLFMSFLDTLNMCWHLWAHILLVSLAFVSEWHHRHDLHLLSFHKQHPDGKKKNKKKNTMRSLHIRLRASDANSLYNNLLNVISHEPIKLNKLGVAAGFGLYVAVGGIALQHRGSASCWNGRWCIAHPLA